MTEYKIGFKQLARLEMQHFSHFSVFIWGSLLCFSIDQGVPGAEKG